MVGSSAGATGSLARARFDAVIARHATVLGVVAKKLCGERALAADLVQDTLERAWRSIDGLRDDDSARAWLIRIMRNTWLDQLRRRRTRTEVPIDEAGPLTSEPEPEPEVGSVWERITDDDFRRAIEQLEEPFRSVAILHDLDQLTYDQIGERLGIPYATAASRLHRAHRKLRALLRAVLDARDGS